MADYGLANYWALIKDSIVLNTVVFDMPETEIQNFVKTLGADFAISCEPHGISPSCGYTWDGEKFQAPPSPVEEESPPTT
jgi:hypothetical protein